MGQYVDFYCNDNNRELKKLVNQFLINNFAWIPQKDYDDFYSIAAQVVWDCERKFDSEKVKTKKFRSYLSNCIHNKIKTQLTYMHRDKRVLKDDKGKPMYDTSIDLPDDNGIELGDKLSSDFQIEDKLELESTLGENTIAYLNTLSPTQKKIAQLIMCGYESFVIKEKLQLTDKQYTNHVKHMTSFEKASLLKKNSNVETEECPMDNNQIVSQTNEKSKVEKYSITSIIRKMNNGTLRYDHPLQRESDQHSTKMKSNLMSDILQGNPIPALVFAEQVINGISITWNLDGKQRSTNVKEFTEDKFKISKSVRRNIIKYQAMIKDENGNLKLDEKGFPQAEWREFDIVNKKFSQLPTELQDKFMDYCFDITLYMNCSDEDIAYHIERYNDGKQMANSQKGIIKLGEEYARMTKGISAMPFFQDNGFTYKENKNGTIDRVCIETIMATEFLNDWKTSPEEIAIFLKQNAKEEHFDNLEDTVERLEKVVTDEVGEMFDKKDSFIYFTAFSEFKKTGLDDSIFIEFLSTQAEVLHNKFAEIEIDKESNKKKSTKDKVVVIEKINFTKNLMKEYFHTKEIESKSINNEDFISENVELPIEEVRQNMEMYEATLTQLEDKTIRDGSKLLDQENRLSMLSMVAYSYKNYVDLDDWLEDYAGKHNMYLKNQKQNYVAMLDSFNNYMQRAIAC